MYEPAHPAVHGPLMRRPRCPAQPGIWRMQGFGESGCDAALFFLSKP